jgi:hypothetical protein
MTSLNLEEMLRLQQQMQITGATQNGLSGARTGVDDSDRVYTQNRSSAGLTDVADPEKAYADLTRREYLDYIQNYRGFEEQLINKAQTDRALIDQARKDVGVASALTQGVASRNVQRYGVALTPDQIQQQGLRLQRANTLGGIQAVNDAKIAQREANTALLSDLINIGQGVNRASQQQLGSAAADATARRNAYTQAKAQSKANTYSTIGSLASAAILAFAF